MSDLPAPGFLLVDSAAPERDRLQRAMEARGWRVWVADGASAAVRACVERSDAIQAAVVGLQLPGMEGARVLVQLAEVAPSLARFAFSPECSPHVSAAFRRLTQTPLFAAPVHPPTLDAALRACLNCEVKPRIAHARVRLDSTAGRAWGASVCLDVGIAALSNSWTPCATAEPPPSAAARAGS